MFTYFIDVVPVFNHIAFNLNERKMEDYLWGVEKDLVDYLMGLTDSLWKMRNVNSVSMHRLSTRAHYIVESESEIFASPLFIESPVNRYGTSFSVSFKEVKDGQVVACESYLWS